MTILQFDLPPKITDFTALTTSGLINVNGHVMCDEGDFIYYPNVTTIED